MIDMTPVSAVLAVRCVGRRVEPGLILLHPVEDRYETHIDHLWSAMTDPGRLARVVTDLGRAGPCDPPTGD